MVSIAHTTTALAPLPAQWDGVQGAWLAEVIQRTGSPRTPEEYGRYMARYMDRRATPNHMNPAHVHAFAYGTGPSGR